MLELVCNFSRMVTGWLYLTLEPVVEWRVETLFQYMASKCLFNCLPIGKSQKSKQKGRHVHDNISYSVYTTMGTCIRAKHSMAKRLSALDFLFTHDVLF